jgi:glycosyltransferase involved in cell wall biosynthesis
MTPILFIAYYFPPMGGAGSQRSLKFANYLPTHGYRPIVLSGASGTSDRWAPVDRGLESELSNPNVKIRRAGILDTPLPGKIPTAITEWMGRMHPFGIRWLNVIRRHGADLCEIHRPKLILATMSPFETAAGAVELSARFSIPWVADLRDPWALDEWQVYKTRWHARAKRNQMERELQSASLIIMNTPEAANRCREAFPSLSHIPIVCIPNGFDANDFEGPLEPLRNPRFTIVHTGALHTDKGLAQSKWRMLYHALGRAHPGVEFLSRSHVFLMRAIEKWTREEPARRDDVRLILAGVTTESDRAVVAASGVEGMVEMTGYLSHRQSLDLVRRADLLFLPMHQVGSGQKASIVPGKTYEYMASGRPILAAVPDGDAKDFLSRRGTGRIVSPPDVDGMLGVLRACHREWASSAANKPQDWNSQFVSQFERRNLTKRLAGELAKLVPPAAVACPHLESV